MKHLLLGGTSVALIAGTLAAITGAALLGYVGGVKIGGDKKMDAVDVIVKERTK